MSSQSRLAILAGLTRSEINRVKKNERPGVQAVIIGRLAAALHAECWAGAAAP